MATETAETPETPTEEQASTKSKLPSLFKKNSSENSRRPPANKWFQQQIPACRPVFTALSASVGFISIGIAFIIIGAVFTAFGSRLRQFEVSYQDCGPVPSDAPVVRGFSSCEAYLANISVHSNFQRLLLPDCHCSINFTLPEDIRPSWNFYYGMRNYYQNHRRYLNSWDVSQLRGSGFDSPSSDCRPIIRISDSASNATDVFPVVPCGLIANSWFNDSFDYFGSDDGMTEITLDRTNIAWNTDRSIRFRNPGRDQKNINQTDLLNTVMPPNWPRSLAGINGGLQNESLMVWFRVAAFPWFRKLYGRPSVNGDRQGILPNGDYNVFLTYNYPVDSFSGTKSIVLAESDWLGGRNLFLGVAYLVVGVLLLIISVGLLVMHFFCSKWKLDNASFDTM